MDKKPQRVNDNVAVSSGFGQRAQRGFVTIEVNDVAVQMDTKKAQEVALMLLQAAAEFLRLLAGPAAAATEQAA